MPQYQGVWSLQQQMQALTSGQWATDPLFDYTTLLLQADDTGNGSQNQTFLDSSTNNFFITRNGNTTQGTFSPFSLQPGAWANYFNGSSSLDTSSTAVSNFGTGAYTVEFWIYLSSYSAGVVPFIWGCPAVAGPPQFNVNSNGTLALAASGGSTVFTSTSTLPLNTWTHVALVRTSTSSNGLTCYFNGVAGGTGTDATNWSATQSFRIATSSSGGSDWSMTGYLSNFRVCKAAVYTGNFTPSTIALTTTSQGASSCVLLACQNNRFLDNSSTASTFTVTGTPSVQAFSPFAPQFQYTASVTGGSGYSDGTGDYLTVATNANLTLGSSDFTIELWWYPTAFNADGEIFTMGSSGGTNRCYAMYSYGSNGTLGAFAGTGGSTWDIVSNLSMGTARLNSWNHMAFTRSGSTFSTYLNGSRIATTTASGTLGSNALGVFANNSGTSAAPAGYIGGARTIKGTALYTGTTYTIPTAPFTAVTNTNLLLNFTNAGILDGTMKNNLETVGNASVSTSVVKYGSGSMYFDGTGDYLRAPNSQNIAFGTGDFTIEMWLWFNATPTGDVVVMEARPSNTAVPWIITADATSGGTLYFYDGTTYRSTIPITPQAWMHFAVSRVNGTLRIFNNGVQGFSGTVTTSLNPTGSLIIGARNDGLVPFTGYMDDIRITKGFGRYTQNFIPPSVALPRQ